MLSNSSIALIFIIIVVAGVFIYIHLKNNSDLEQSPVFLSSLVDAIFGTNQTSSEENQILIEENQTSSDENQTSSDKNQTSTLDNVISGPADIFNNTKNEVVKSIKSSIVLNNDEKKKGNESSFDTKHKYFIISLNNSINYCKNNSKFKYVDYLLKYKNIYMKLHKKIKNKDSYSTYQYNSLIKKYTSILDNLNQKISN